MLIAGYCECCGSPLGDGVRFCDRCGADQQEAICRLQEVALELRKNSARTELLTLAWEKERRRQGKREVADLTHTRNIVKTEISLPEASVRSLNEDIEKLDRTRFAAEENLGRQVAVLTERIDGLREEPDPLHAYVLDLSKRREATEADVDPFRAEQARLLADVIEARTAIEGLTGDLSSPCPAAGKILKHRARSEFIISATEKRRIEKEIVDLIRSRNVIKTEINQSEASVRLRSSSAGEHFMKLRGAGEIRQEASAPTISRRIMVALLIFAVVGVSLLAAVSLHASNPSDPTTITETYVSVGTSTVTVDSQFTAVQQISPIGSELLMPVFGRWVTRSVTVQVNSNSSLESWILMRAIETWNGAEANFSGGTPAYELIEVMGEAQITVNFVSSLPASLDGSTSCQQTKLPTGSWVDGVFTSCVIQMSNAIFTVSGEQLAYRLALHEVGHALGLGTLEGSTDLMDAAGWQQATGISTLDLYALQTLSTVSANGGAPSFIALNENTPYRVVSESLT